MIALNPLRLLCFEENALLSDSLAAFFAHQHSIDFLGIVEDESELDGVIADSHPTVLLMDTNVTEGMPLMLHIKALFPEVRILILSDDGDASSVDLAADAGAMGYLIKFATTSRALIDAVHRVAAGDFFIGEFVPPRCEARPACAA